MAKTKEKKAKCPFEACDMEKCPLIKALKTLDGPWRASYPPYPIITYIYQPTVSPKPLDYWRPNYDWEYTGTGTYEDRGNWTVTYA